jgi:hypothetical protein
MFFELIYFKHIPELCVDFSSDLDGKESCFLWENYLPVDVPQFLVYRELRVDLLEIFLFLIWHIVHLVD